MQGTPNMKTLIAILISAGAYVALSSPQAAAQGVHIGAAGVHADVGHPHAGYGYQSYYGGRGHMYGQGYYGSRGVYRGHMDLHNSGHYDIHRGGYQRHFNHLDYAPAHYDYHSQGHWDYHR